MAGSRTAFPPSRSRPAPLPGHHPYAAPGRVEDGRVLQGEPDGPGPTVADARTGHAPIFSPMADFRWQPRRSERGCGTPTGMTGSILRRFHSTSMDGATERRTLSILCLVGVAIALITLNQGRIQSNTKVIAVSLGLIGIMIAAGIAASRSDRVRSESDDE